MLCPVCEAKLKEGKITNADVAASRALVKYAEHSRALDSVVLNKAYNTERYFLVEVNVAAVPVLRNEQVRTELERLIGGKILVAAYGTSSRRFIEDLVQPFRVSQMSTLWLPDGSKVSKIVVSPARKTIGARLGAAQRLAKAARGIELQVDQTAGERVSEDVSSESRTVSIIPPLIRQ